MVRQVQGFFVRAALVVLFAGLTASASAPASFISGDALQSYGSTGRSLLQAKKSCPINFEFMNYTIITSKCKGPQYKADLCCPAFKEFACPYADELNDQTNDCASTMFSYINLYGKYPPGLFAYECREGKEGLDCMTFISKSDNSTATSSASMKLGLFPVLAVAPVFLAAALL